MRGRPIWSPDGSQLAFVTFNGLYRVSRSGDHLEKLLDHRIPADFLSWSPDGKFLLFPFDEPLVEGAEPLQIYLLELSTLKLSRVSRGRRSDSPCWSPDSKRVAYLEFKPTDKESARDIVSVDLTGGDPKKLTRDGVYKGLPAWCPDGSCLAYVGECPKRETSGLIVVDLKTGAGRMLIEAPDAGLPVWSPDGKRIAYTKGSPRDVYVVDRSGEHEVRLSKDADVWEFPTWSPDGQRVAFSADIDGTRQVYSDRFDGKDPRRHTSEKEGASDPSWAPFR